MERLDTSMFTKYLSFILLFVLLLTSCESKVDIPTKSHNVITRNECHNADSKFINDSYVLTSLNGKLTILDAELKTYKTYEVLSDWCDSCYVNSQYYIISGNFQNETNLTVIDKEYNLVCNKLISKTENLCIDQAITYFDNEFYFTQTEIIGVVNNQNSNGNNGLYTIKLYKTLDFNNITYVMDIDSQYRNLEDIELLVINGKLACTYEIETAHTALSEIHMKTTNKTLFDTDYILASDGDDEPAKFIFDSPSILFYASDKENPGMSYDGSSIYAIEYNSDFEAINEQKLDSKNTGIHLYDCIMKANEIKCLYSINYYATRDLVIETFIN